ncbi:(d)CMP kinase [Chlorobium sp. N1]|uniref:(d)CMP kinase n=1 Tax=Chlorobium sp. N1 TaxID=2491138 RepID=UPI001039AFA7|nr:(d)CMP kinase [Chlorobium sp. N1]TCD48864.1 (d)CMP kinase [Chlorobium sp. N1]
MISTNRIIIAIDGPAASGKSTTARRVARQLGYTYIDTGAMYRSVALKAIEGGLLESIRRDPGQVASILEGISIRFEGERILLDGRDVSREIRDNRVSREVSFLSSLKPVRDCLLVMQQALGRGRGVVMDGRDIGTVVFPDAELKIFLVADARERARRRLLELQAKSEGKTALPDIETLEREILERDRADAEREHAPLRKHPDAVEIDTSKLDIDQQVEMVYRLARKTEAAG